MNTFHRIEKKYLVSQETYNEILPLLMEHTHLDQHCQNESFYPICNIYYDTTDHTVLKDSVSKPVFKQKLRLRCYCNPTEDSIVYLELKRKYKGVVNKRRTKIRYRDAMNLVTNKILPKQEKYHNWQVVKEIYYYVKDKDLIPNVMLTYDRIALFDNSNDDLRITFDKDIISHELDYQNFEDQKIIDDTYMIMEIKSTLNYPLWLSQILSKYNIRSSSFSKIGTDFYNKLNIQMNRSGDLCLNPYLMPLQ
jgi:SPX domain protein involved in polyphosphate accumulation